MIISTRPGLMMYWAVQQLLHKDYFSGLQLNFYRTGK